MSTIRTSGKVAIFALTALSGASLVSHAQAQSNGQPLSGFYVGGAAGVNIMQEVPVTSIGNYSTSNINLQTDAGAAAVLSGGYGWGNGIRTEFQLNYRYNSYSQLSLGNVGNVSLNNSHVSGSEQKFGPMPTILYDFYTLSPVYVPYVGLGVGYQLVDEKLTVGGTSESKTKGNFAGQAILGVAFPISSVPGLAITADYRFLAVAGNRTYNNVTLGNDFNHSIMIGVRYAFGSPPPPPPAPMAAPAPAPARSYLVFFDWDKATLTGRAQQIIKEAADNSTKVQYTRIDVNGYTDTSGTPQYNQGLSVRRAQAVAAELVKDGVPKTAIAIQGFGETHLLVPTGAGVREPQNRRVEIIIH
jgi:opacity protein-like surface antigen